MLWILKHERKHLQTGVYFCLSLPESNLTETVAFAIKLNERNWFLYVDVKRITARIDSVIFTKSEALSQQLVDCILTSQRSP